MQANVFSIEKTHQHILFWREIHSFVSINDRNWTPSCPYSVSVFKIESGSRTQLGNLFFGFQSKRNDCSQDCLRPVCVINFSKDQSSDKLINFLDSQLDTRDSKLSRIEYRVSRLEYRGSRDCQLTFERYCIVHILYTVCIYFYYRYYFILYSFYLFSLRY